MFIEIMNNCGFTQTLKFATRRNNILDIFCTNRPTLLSGCYHIPGIGDQKVVLVKSLTSAQMGPPVKHNIYQ